MKRAKELENNKTRKRNAIGASEKPMKRKSKKAKAGPKKPKRPLSAYMLFSYDFAKDFKKTHDPKTISVPAFLQATDDKWDSMTLADKARYEAIYADNKKEYKLAMTAYNSKLKENAQMAAQGCASSNHGVNEEEDDQEDE